MMAGDSARAARRERHAADMRKGRTQRLIKQHWKKAALIAGVALLISAVAVTQTTGIGQKDCPGHWHATFQVYVDDQAVNMAPTSAQNDAAPGFHMHGNDNLLHTHPAVERCIPLGKALQSLNVDISSEAIDVGPLQGADRASTQGRYAIAGDSELKIYVQPWQGEWREVARSFLDDQVGNGAKVLITYGTLDAETIARQQASVPDIPDNYKPQ